MVPGPNPQQNHLDLKAAHLLPLHLRRAPFRHRVGFFGPGIGWYDSRSSRTIPLDDPPTAVADKLNHQNTITELVPDKTCPYVLLCSHL